MAGNGVERKRQKGPALFQRPITSRETGSLTTCYLVGLVAGIDLPLGKPADPGGQVGLEKTAITI